MDLEDLEIYQESMRLGESVWKIVGRWPYFAKDTVGKQWVRSMDSVAANLAEGFGRFHFNDNKRFCYYSRGSLRESATWLAKAKQRNLVDEESYTDLVASFRDLRRRLDAYIKSIGPRPGA